MFGKMILVGFFLFSNLVFAQTPIGMDPGMTKALAASMYPHLPDYVEFCPDGPGGRCAGVIPAGGGFYTLPVEINYLMELPQNKRNGFFRWIKDVDGVGWIAELTVDSRSYSSPLTTNLYNGLQLNTPVGVLYGGITLNRPEQTPLMDDVSFAGFEYRAVTCALEKQGPTMHGYLHYYVSFWDVVAKQGFQLAIDYGHFWHGPSGPPLSFADDVATEQQLCVKANVPISNPFCDPHTYHFQAHLIGLLPMPANGGGVALDMSPNCSLKVESQPWVKMNVPIASFVSLLRRKGEISPQGNFRYMGGIIAGVEWWGRNKTVLQVRKHSLYRGGPSTPPGGLRYPAGKFRTQNSFGAELWYSNGWDASCRYVNLLHAGVASASAISQIYPAPPTQMRLDWCPGSDQLSLTAP